MKLFVLAILFVMCSASVNALTLYGDPATGRIFYLPGENRIVLGVVSEKEFAEAESVVREASTAKAQVSASDNKTSKASWVADKSDHSITIINQKSADFLLGKQTHISMKFEPEDAPDMWFKAGVRVQGSLETTDTTKFNDGSSVKSSTDFDDAYLRRVRLEISAGFGEHASFVMDLRNDRANFGIDNNERGFSIGDAYVKISKPFDTSLLNFKFYRAKIDVSRTETVKSARIIAYDRPFVADAAAQYISLNRRGANVQVYGDWKKKIHYQLAFGSASSPDKALDAAGIKGSSVDIDLDDQSFFYGGKVILSPFDGWEETSRTESYFGEGKHFSMGAAYWVVPTLKGSAQFDNNITSSFDLNRKLINFEVSGHYNGFFAQAEYFKFKDAVKQWDLGITGEVETGSSSGWYVTSEYVFKNFYYLAPFARYENWDRFDGAKGYDVKSTLFGINWYLRGNTTKVGFVYQEDEFGENTGNKDVKKLRFTSQWFF